MWADRQTKLLPYIFTLCKYKVPALRTTNKVPNNFKCFVVSRFLTRCPKLRLLDVSFCDHVQDSEVAYWRMVFPHVSVKRSFQRDIMS
jgi:hypothetical protein